MEMVIFLLEFQEIWPLTSTAEGLYSELCLSKEKKFPFSYNRLSAAVIRNRCNSAAFPSMALNLH